MTYQCRVCGRKFNDGACSGCGRTRDQERASIYGLSATLSSSGPGSMTLPPDKIHDRGQRFLVEAEGYPKARWCAVGYVTNLKDAWKTAEIIALNPGVTQTRITDRHVRGVPLSLTSPSDEYPVRIREVIYPVRITDLSKGGREPDDMEKIAASLRKVADEPAIVAWCWPSSTFNTVNTVTLFGLKPQAISTVHGKGFLVLYTNDGKPSEAAWQAWATIAAAEENAGNASNWIGWYKLKKPSRWEP